VPVIPAKPGDWIDLYSLTSRLGLYPGEGGDESQIEKDIAGNILNRQIDLSKPGSVRLSVQSAKTLYGASPKPNLFKEIAPRAEKSKNAGAILLNTLRLAVYWEEKASVENAIKLLAADLEIRKRPNSRSTLMAQWKEYKNVSHFTAAMLLAEANTLATGVNVAATLHSHLAVESAAPVPAKPRKLSNFFARIKWIGRIYRSIARFFSANLPEYFSIAEELRKLGEQHKSHGQAAQGLSTLDPEHTWKVPDGFILPPAKVQFPKLTNAEIDILLADK
jgi:hypothetical protein